MLLLSHSPSLNGHKEQQRCLRKASVTSEKGRKENLGNCRLVSLPPSLGRGWKSLSCIVISKHVKEVISNNQHGFTVGK